MEAVSTIRVSEISARLAMPSLKILTRDINDISLLQILNRVAVEQVFFVDHGPALGRRVIVIQLFAGGATRLSPRQSRNAHLTVAARSILLLVAHWLVIVSVLMIRESV